ncbi:MAG: TIGR01777 family oxidoreductase [Candidatus Korobacteraceae bacterium]
MKVLVSGAGGMIGHAVSTQLRARQHQVSALVRDPQRARPGDLLWQPSSPVDPSQLAVFDAIVHLAGSPVAVRWTAAAKAEIRNSRVEGTANLARAAAQAQQQSGQPKVLICASAIGYYGSRGEETLVEDSAPGLGFLAEVCCQWEAAALPAAMAGVRVVHMRSSLVLSPSGGALAKMLPAFRLGAAGTLGGGRQWWSWISLEDAARAFVFALENEHAHGALNVAAPHPVTNAEFTRTLGRIVGRPELLALPAFALRLAGGEMADELLLASQRVLPRRLLEAGFQFEDAELEPALRRLLNRPTSRTLASAE